MKKAVLSPLAPAPIGPYSQGIRSGNMVFLSGQIALDPKTGDLLMDDIEMETHRVMKNVEALLKAEGLGFQHIVKSSIFLSDMSLFLEMNKVYGSYFKDIPPARETVAVAGLPRGVNVEISVIAIAP
jgi:2-iminobutanoate/2-iminopropanoate deaminase